MRVATVINALKSKGINIQRYGLSTDTQRFILNPVISDLLEKEGAGVLPITLVDGIVGKTKTYPTNEEFADWLETRLDVVQTIRQGGCCGGQRDAAT